MHDRIDPYKAILRVLDSEKELNDFLLSHKEECWILFSGEQFRNPGINCLWKNRIGNVIVKEKGDNFYTMCESMEDFIYLQESWEVSDSGLGKFSGFNDNFLDEVMVLSNDLCKRYIGCESAHFTKEEFRKIAESCTVESFCQESDMAEVTAYSGQFIVVNVPGFSWGTDKKVHGNNVELTPYVFSNEYGKVYTVHEILHSLDKKYSDEFLWGAVPFELQRYFEKKAGEKLL